MVTAFSLTLKSTIGNQVFKDKKSFYEAIGQRTCVRSNVNF